MLLQLHAHSIISSGKSIHYVARVQFQCATPSVVTIGRAFRMANYTGKNYSSVPESMCLGRR